MKCDDAKPLLDLMLDDVLEAKDSALVLDHLKTCDKCQGEWNDLEAMRTRFQSARKSPALPSGLIEKISDRLREEEKIVNKQSNGFFSKALPVMALVACLLVIGLFVLPGQRSINSLQTASADALVDDLSRSETVTPVADKSELSRQIGYDLKFVRLPQWQMNRSGVYKSKFASPIARFDFIKKTDVGGDSARMSCYQALQGTISAEGAVSEDIQGKSVLFGKRGEYSYALMSQNGRDYLFISALPKSQLEEIIHGV